MKTLQSLSLGWIVSIAISLSGIALAQSDNLEAQRAVVVKLRIHRADQADETAAGLFVGKDSKSAYFVTAYHAVGPNSQGVPVHSVELQFYTTPQNFDAFVIDHFDEGLDLGVVRTAVGNLPPDLPKIATRDVALVPVHIIGHPSAGEWSFWSGSVQNETAGDDTHRFTTNRDESLAGGYSGGPVFDSHGSFLGMHTSTVTSYGIAAKSSDIVNQLKAWHVPTNNFTAQAVVGSDGATPYPPGQADRDAINRILDLYCDAYDHRDKNALWKIWPNPPAAIKQKIEAYFRIARSIVMKVSDRTIELDGARATATAQYSQEFVPKDGNSQRSNGPIGFTLEKRDGTWVIVDVE